MQKHQNAVLLLQNISLSHEIIFYLFYLHRWIVRQYNLYWSSIVWTGNIDTSDSVHNLYKEKKIKSQGKLMSNKSALITFF